MGDAKGLSTRAVHAGDKEDDVTGAVGTPVYQTSTFQYPRRRLRDGSWVENPDWIYTRYANPTTRAVEEKVAELEGTEDALLFASGMAAISAAILGNVRSGEHVVAMSDVYGGTQQLLDGQAADLGVEVSMVPGASVEGLLDACRQDTKLVYAEVPTNPFNRVLDLPALVAGLEDRYGRDRRPLVVVDATLASPINLRPAEHGVDLVVHSATKYLNGHSDVIAGVVAGSRTRIEALRPWLKSIGASMDPHQAYLLGRGIRTLALRVARQNENARRLAEFLAAHPAVGRVWYPGVDDHPDTEVAARLLEGFGGIVTFQLKSGDRADARAFIESLRLFHAAASLGGVESLASLPVECSHASVPKARREALGITDTVVRLAVGIEDAEDLVADVAQALGSG